MTTTTIDEKALQFAVLRRLLLADDQIVELRALKVKHGDRASYTAAGFFAPGNDEDMREALNEVHKDAQGIYFTLNPVNPALLARSANRMKRAEAGDLTKDGDILCRRWLMVDVDPVRPSGISSTAAEKMAAGQVVHTVKTYLESHGWPAPIVTDSGNGFHLLYRIDLPADDGGLVQRCLAALAKDFDTPEATIDKTVHNPARICKFPYTNARKGDATEDRPHRQAKLLEIPHIGLIDKRPIDLPPNWQIDVVSIALLQQLADTATTAPVQKPTAPTQPKRAKNSQSPNRLLVNRWLEDRGIVFETKPERDDKGRIVYKLAVCPFNPEHGADAAIFQGEDGKMGAHCFHAGCADNRWEQFKIQIGEPEPHHYEQASGTNSPQAPAATPSSKPSRKAVLITDNEACVNDKVVAILHHEPGLYQRNGALVRLHIAEATSTNALATAPRIEEVPTASLREIISKHVCFIKETEDGPEPSHPPCWCVNALAARIVYPDVPVLSGIVTHPILLPDGSLLTQYGYDPTSGMYLHWPGQPLCVPETPTRDDALAAVACLMELVQDFPFPEPLYRSAWLAALLTPFIRTAYVGPAPLFLVDGNVRGVGKGLLLEMVSLIATGNAFAVTSYPSGSGHAEEELRKKITTALMYGDRMLLFDNLTGSLGDGTLDRCLTATEWKDRKLGANAQFTGLMNITFYATGNNVSIRADTARRICHILLESPEERPENRSDFRNPDLLNHVKENRDSYIVAALTILRAYHAAGRPAQTIKPWGSFMGWSNQVRNPLVWCGLPDPGETRTHLQEDADEAANGLRQLHQALQKIDPKQTGLTAAEILRRATDDDLTTAPADREQLYETLIVLLGPNCNARQLGCFLRQHRRRVVDGLVIDQKSQEHGITRWIVRKAGR